MLLASARLSVTVGKPLARVLERIHLGMGNGKGGGDLTSHALLSGARGSSDPGANPPPPPVFGAPARPLALQTRCQLPKAALPLSPSWSPRAAPLLPPASPLPPSASFASPGSAAAVPLLLSAAACVPRSPSSLAPLLLCRIRLGLIKRMLVTKAARRVDLESKHYWPNEHTKRNVIRDRNPIKGRAVNNSGRLGRISSPGLPSRPNSACT